MKLLLILRHAKSSWAQDDCDDHDRPLKKRGLRDAPAIGRLLRVEGLVPDLILCSTALRARQTAEHVVEHSGFDGALQHHEALYLAEPRDQILLLRQLSDGPERVMLVGHNPGLETLAERLSDSCLTLPTASLVAIGLPIDRWSELGDETRGELLGHWKPRELPE